MEFVEEKGLFPEGTFGGDPYETIYGDFKVSFRDGNSPHGNKSSISVDVTHIAN
jgi:torulene dioxygenase